MLPDGLEALSREWMNFTQGRVLKNAEGFRAMLACRKLDDMLALQSNLMRDNLDQAISSGLRIAELSMSVAEHALVARTAEREPVTARASTIA